MTREDKELLLKDLCARLPYGVIALTEKGKGHICDINLTIFGTEIGVNVNPIARDTFSIDDIKPYLFPLSSMTEEQKKEYNLLRDFVPTYHYEYGDIVEDTELYDNWGSIDYLIANHFDYRGLIEKSLALDATGLNIY